VFGININITLIFSLKQYVDTSNAYIRGLSHRNKENKDISKARFVASVFVSRINALVDEKINSLLSGCKDEQK